MSTLTKIPCCDSCGTTKLSPTYVSCGENIELLRHSRVPRIDSMDHDVPYVFCRKCARMLTKLVCDHTKQGFDDVAQQLGWDDMDQETIYPHTYPTLLGPDESHEEQILVTCQVDMTGLPHMLQKVKLAVRNAITHAVMDAEASGFAHPLAADVAIGIGTIENLDAYKSVVLMDAQSVAHGEHLAVGAFQIPAHAVDSFHAHVITAREKLQAEHGDDYCGQMLVEALRVLGWLAVSPPEELSV